MSRNYVICCLLILSLGACNNNHASKKLTIIKPCDSCCLKKLAHFADTLNIDTSKSLSYYFNDKTFTLGNCQLKKLRGNASLKSSLVLIWLKIDNLYLKHNWNYNYIQEMFGDSKTAYQIVYEFYFLAMKKDEISIEYMSAAWVNDIIASDHSLLKNKQISKIYSENKIFNIYNKKKRRHK